MPLLESGDRRVNRCIILLNKGPEIFSRGPVRQTDAAGGPGFDGHIAQSHSGFHAHGRHRRPAKLHDPIGGPVDRKVFDYMENHILGINPTGQRTGYVDFNGFGQAKGADPLQNSDLQISGAHPGGKSPKGAVRAGVGIPHDHRVAGANKALFGKQGVANPIAPDIKKITDIMTPGPIPQNLALSGGFGIFSRSNMINYHLDFFRIKHPIHPPGDKIGNGDRSSDFMTHHHVQAQDRVYQGRSVATVAGENFLNDGPSH